MEWNKDPKDITLRGSYLMKLEHGWPLEMKEAESIICGMRSSEAPRQDDF